ncbi:hypothetical protein GW920_01850 [Candidatus Falkowbacteria bacterium]|uniref:O-antigen ligase-related domain-containing protein n=1 Tax=Candidatus Falkowbacteria bacterium CG10_big_fil_rev_8_21_14_0_10_37_18 TaxID=1974562 RepID=A0A2H0VC39_9BACT|nr:hypothetical protein [Candidatus Falkowbacteria bacterium]NCQ12937.1 hypothetical protein [Candidatus Falkowbacteria bacterium]OIO05955.1 MAG: hypothetical protein AUJ26_01980 [Candidatus Falkowbacteria bacterium CG1_02_37_21]PIR95870.1 MAG: hypothetical protein COT93_00160 [Candidatus Falkowbacteria bacterium CG10_big_fil_rev_8_21_14_0_10_37_18]
MLIAIAIFTVLFFILTLRKPDWALLLLIASLPAYLIRFNIQGLPLTLLEVMILISFATWVLRDALPHIKTWIKNKELRESYPFAWEIIALLIISWIAVGVSGWSMGAWGIWKAYFFEPLLVFILIFNIFKHKKDLLKIFWAFLISALAVALFAVWQQVTGLYIDNPFWAAEATRRVVSFFGFPNAIGLYLAPLTMVLAGWLVFIHLSKPREGTFQQIIIAVTIILSLLAIYFAHSEGALVGIIAGLIMFGLLSGKWQRIITIVVLVAAISGLLSFAPRAEKIIDKLTLSDLSGEIRQQQWKETFTMLNDSHLILGAGLDNYKNSIKPYHQEGIFFNSDKIANFDAVTWASSTLQVKYWQPTEIYLYPHNIFLNFWSELGLAGLLLFVWLIGKYLWMSLRLSVALGRARSPEKYISLGLLAAMTAILVQGLVDVPYFKNDLSVMFWILLAIIGALDLSCRHDRELKN